MSTTAKISFKVENIGWLNCFLTGQISMAFHSRLKRRFFDFKRFLSFYEVQMMSASAPRLFSGRMSYIAHFYPMLLPDQ